MGQRINYVHDVSKDSLLPFERAREKLEKIMTHVNKQKENYMPVTAP